ncbi:MAG: hypothetical protein AABX13_00685 [Nanoarchaeota archaeon]
MRKEKIIVNEKEYDVYISLEQRDSARASIGRTGLHLRVPIGMSREEQFKEILRLKRWAVEKIKEKPPEFIQKGSRTYHDGDKLQLANEEYLIRLAFSDTQSSSARAIGDTFYIKVSSVLPEKIRQKHISVLLSRLAARGTGHARLSGEREVVKREHG